MQAPISQPLSRMHLSADTFDLENCTRAPNKPNLDSQGFRRACQLALCWNTLENRRGPSCTGAIKNEEIRMMQSQRQCTAALNSMTWQSWLMPPKTKSIRPRCSIMFYLCYQIDYQLPANSPCVRTDAITVQTVHPCSELLQSDVSASTTRQ